MSLSKKLNEFANEPALSLKPQPFISEIPPTLRAAKRINIKEIRVIAKEAEKLLSKVRRLYDGGVTPTILAGEIEGYWDLFQKLSELADEFKTQMEDVRAAP